MSQVKFFRSTDFGAPQLFGNAGFLIPVLDACLVDGYGLQSVVNMVHSGGIVTVTTASSHGLATYSRQTIAGANEDGYNGSFVITVINGTVFTYAASGITVDTATGTISTRTGSAGWTKPFSGTNLAAYRTGGGLQHYYRFDDTTTIAAKVRGYVSMSDVNIGVDPFPSVTQAAGSGLFWQKSVIANATTAKEWIIYADDKTMYMFVYYGTAINYDSLCIMGMGEYTSYKQGDLYSSFVSAATGQSSYSLMLFGALYNVEGNLSSGTAAAMYSPRSYTQVGTSVSIAKCADRTKANQGYMGYGGLPYPHPVESGLLMSPVYVQEGAATADQCVLRGIMRGIWNPLHTYPMSHYAIFDGNGQFIDKKFQAIIFGPGGAHLGQAFFDISESWG